MYSLQVVLNYVRGMHPPGIRDFGKLKLSVRFFVVLLSSPRITTAFGSQKIAFACFDKRLSCNLFSLIVSYRNESCLVRPLRVIEITSTIRNLKSLC